MTDFCLQKVDSKLMFTQLSIDFRFRSRIATHDPNRTKVWSGQEVLTSCTTFIQVYQILHGARPSAACSQRTANRRQLISGSIALSRMPTGLSSTGHRRPYSAGCAPAEYSSVVYHRVPTGGARLVLLCSRYIHLPRASHRLSAGLSFTSMGFHYFHA